MAKKGKKNKNVQSNEVLENPEALAEKITQSEEWIEKHQTLLISLLGVVAVIVAGGFFYNYYMQQQNALAQDDMFQAVYYFESDSVDLALRGDGNNYGFLDIIDEYGSTKAGNLANYYAGACYIQKGNYSSAIPFLKDFSSDDLLLTARANSLLGDAYMEAEDFATAASYYEKASSYKPNKEFTPLYLMKAALAYKMNGQNDKAIQKYDKVIEEYKNTPEYNNAKKYKAMLEYQG